MPPIEANQVAKAMSNYKIGMRFFMYGYGIAFQLFTTNHFPLF